MQWSCPKAIRVVVQFSGEVIEAMPDGWPKSRICVHPDQPCGQELSLILPEFWTWKLKKKKMDSCLSFPGTLECLLEHPVSKSLQLQI